MRSLGVGFAITILGFLAADRAAPQTSDDFEILGRALDGAVRQVSRASLVHGLGLGEGCRAYPLTGFGVVFVISPRQLPFRAPLAIPLLPGHAPDDVALERTLSMLQETLRHVDSEDLRIQIQHRIDVLKRAQEAARTRRAERAAAESEARRVATEETRRREEIKRIEDQAKILEREAAEAAARAEATFSQITRRLQQEAAASSPMAPDAPMVPGVAESVEIPIIESPPWSSWFEIGDEAQRTSEDVVKDVRSAVVNVLESRGANLRPLRPEEVLAVAVDFYSRGAFMPRDRPQRTLVVRVRKQDLLDRKAGKISVEELRRRIEARDY